MNRKVSEFNAQPNLQLSGTNKLECFPKGAETKPGGGQRRKRSEIGIFFLTPSDLIKSKRRYELWKN